MQELLHTCEVQCMYVLHSAMLNTMHAPTLIVAYTIYALCCQYYVCTYTNGYYINPYFMCLYSYCSRSRFHVVQKSIPRIFINHIKRFYHHFNPPILQTLAAPLERALNKYPGSSSDPTIRLQDQYSFEYTKLASVPTWAP